MSTLTDKSHGENARSTILPDTFYVFLKKIAHEELDYDSGSGDA
jgi:hypothetical protein